MPLDDFFAKKDKKKAKKKQNPQDLIEKLTKEAAKYNEKEGETVSEANKKLSSLPKDDEWETLDDDDKEVDFQSTRINKMSVGKSEDTGKQTSKEKTENNDTDVPEEEKKVWAAKAPEPAEEQVAPAEPERVRGSLYVPMHQRVVAVKPNVESTSDFPTLDAVAEPATTTSATDSKHPDGDDDLWEQAGAPRKPARASEMLPIAVAQPAYMPPSMRRGGAGPIAILPSASEQYSDSRPRDDMFRRNDGLAPRRSERYAPREVSSSFGGDDWSRGKMVESSGFGQGGGSSFKPSVRQSAFPTTASNSGWDRGVTVRTFNDANQEKREFELIQKNRFAGLNET